MCGEEQGRAHPPTRRLGSPLATDSTWGRTGGGDELAASPATGDLPPGHLGAEPTLFSFVVVAEARPASRGPTTTSPTQSRAFRWHCHARKRTARVWSASRRTVRTAFRPPARVPPDRPPDRRPVRQTRTARTHSGPAARRIARSVGRTDRLVGTPIRRLGSVEKPVGLVRTGLGPAGCSRIENKAFYQGQRHISENSTWAFVTKRGREGTPPSKTPVPAGMPPFHTRLTRANVTNRPPVSWSQAHPGKPPGFCLSSPNPKKVATR